MRDLLLSLLVAFLLTGCGLGANKQTLTSINSGDNRQSSANSSPVSGQTLLWEQQGISFIVPVSWRRDKADSESFQVRGPDDLYLSCTVLRRDENYKMEQQLEYEYEAELKGAEPEKDVRYLELDGVTGYHWRTFMPVEDVPYSFLDWRAFRRHRGEVQIIDVSIGGPTEIFTRNQAEIYGILHSLKWAKA